MPEYLVRVHEPQHGIRELRVSTEHPGQVAQALGVSPARVLSVQAAQQRQARTRRSLDLRLFSQELSVLLQAGIPLLEALQTLREKDSGAQSLEDVLGALRNGQPLSSALALAPADFDELFIAVVSASERTGQLGTTLRDHAAYLAWGDALRARLIAAGIYPLMLLGVGGAVIMFLLLYVLPRFAGIFEGMGRTLPGASQALMDLGVAAHAQPVLSLVIALVIPSLALIAWRTRLVREQVARALWASPFIGPRLRILSLARLYRCLSLLLSAGVPVIGALRLADGVLAAPLRQALRAATADVAGGLRLSQTLQARGLATPVALRMLRVGESSGEVAAMFERAAAFHDEEIERFSDVVTRTINPVLMLIMGVVIGGIVVLMYLPIFTLMEQVQ
jgi:general secretion pathway protein F